MKLGVRYKTAYRYAERVGFSPHEIRLFPRAGHFHRVRRLEFACEPPGRVRFLRDVFDNTVAACSFPERARKLQFRLSFDLELEERDPFNFLLHNDAVNLPLAYRPDLRDVLQPYRKRSSRASLELPLWTPPTRAKPRPTVPTLVELNEAVHKSIHYERREEGVARTPAETLRQKRGACRDVAVLLAEILRDMGLAARLASGYLRESGTKTRRAEGSLHAWTDVFLPGAGWVGLDATNGIFCNHNFIPAAVGLTPADITPISGSYYHKEPVPTRMTSRLELVDL